MNILLSSDNNYVQHLAVTIYSLLEHNREESEIFFYVVDNGIAQENIEKLCLMIQPFENAKITFIPFDKWRDSLHLNMSWPISLSSYARLFVASMLPESIEKVLYLDCDMVINKRLSDLWTSDMKGNIIAAVQDAVGDNVKAAVGLLPEDLYFNAGMLLIDLKKWRQQNIEQKCIDFISERQGRVVHHDQGVLNGVFRNAWLRLPLKYNVMTIHYFFNRRKIDRFFDNHSEFYTADEIDNAKDSPAIIHFTPSFTTRPWVRSCKHPLKRLYWDYLEKTPWKGIVPSLDIDKWYVKLINWRYRNLPY